MQLFLYAPHRLSPLHCYQVSSVYSIRLHSDGVHNSSIRTYQRDLVQKTVRVARGWSGSAMVLGKLPVPGRPTIWITVGQGPTALAVGAGGGCLDIFTLICPFSPLSLSLFGRRPDID